MADLVKRIFLDPSRCIGCRSCVAACRECDTHKGESMIYIDYLERHDTVASSLLPAHRPTGARQILPLSRDRRISSISQTPLLLTGARHTPRQCASDI